MCRFCSRSLDVTTAGPTELVWCCLPPFHRRLTGCTCPMNCRKSPSRLSGFLSPLTGFVVWGGTAQWVERRTEKPYAIPTRVRVPGVARAISSRVNCQCRLSCVVRTVPVCSRVHQHLCTRSKSKCWLPHTIVWTHE